METLTRRNLYDEATYRECVDRTETLTPESRPEWGRMSAAQMFAHCAEVLEVTNGKALEKTPVLAKLFRGVIRNAVVNDKPYPKNSRTHPQYIQNEERDFETEKRRFLAALSSFKEDEGTARDHPLFGAMSVDEKGWSMYKHIDHHLRQFRV